jgi:hypothetical protein
MADNFNDLHIKRRRADGKSPHMDRSPCGNLTGAYIVEPTAEDVADKCNRRYRNQLVHWVEGSEAG